eukprot:COSAG01_NODE_22424_length_856_cov_1.239102_1_plen_239_part_10
MVMMTICCSASVLYGPDSVPRITSSLLSSLSGVSSRSAMYKKSGQWRVTPGWDPSDLDHCSGTVASEGGPVPVGAQQWKCYGFDNEWNDGTVTVRELTAEQAAAEAQRLAEEQRQREEPQRQAALAQAQRLGEGGGLSLEGHPIPEVNGLYRRVGQELHEGWPRYKHVSNDVYLYRSQKMGEWRVRPGWDPSDLDQCGGVVASEDNAPVWAGVQQWDCIGLDGEWSDGTVTVRELTDCP